jgi:hypothetical protein
MQKILLGHEIPVIYFWKHHTNQRDIQPQMDLRQVSKVAALGADDKGAQQPQFIMSLNERKK